MTKSSFSFLILALLCLGLNLHAEEAAYSGGGNGTEDKPWRIATVKDWMALSKSPDHWSQHFVLVGDLDFQDAKLTPLGEDPQKQAFTGTFDGKGHTLRNASISSSNKSGTGLFGTVGEGGTLKNITLEGFSVKGFDNVGALVGNLHKGNVENCSSTAEVSGRINIGGLIGKQELSTITKCSAAGKVTGISSATGGLLGLSGGSSWNSGGTISHSRAAAEVKGVRYVGGFIGSMQAGTLTHCSASGKVTGDTHAGGFVGTSKAAISTSFATGEVSCDGTAAGGFVGASGDTISQCYATGKVKGERSTGGFAGVVSGQIINSYATGNATSSQDYTGAFAGRLVNGSLKNCYAIGTVKGNASSTGLVGKGEEKDISASYWLAAEDAAEDKMARSKDALTRNKSEDTYTDWDFSQIWALDSKVNSGYPWLRNIEQ